MTAPRLELVERKCPVCGAGPGQRCMKMAGKNYGATVPGGHPQRSGTTPNHPKMTKARFVRILKAEDTPTFTPRTLRLCVDDAFKNGEKAGAGKEIERIGAIVAHIAKELRWLRKRAVPATTCDDAEFWARFSATIGAVDSATRKARRRSHG